MSVSMGCECMGILWAALDTKCCTTNDEQVGAVHSSLCYQCMYVCMNG